MQTVLENMGYDKTLDKVDYLTEIEPIIQLIISNYKEICPPEEPQDEHLPLVKSPSLVSSLLSSVGNAVSFICGSPSKLPEEVEEENNSFDVFNFQDYDRYTP